MTTIARTTIGAGVDHGRRFRLGLLLYLNGELPADQAFAEGLDLIVEAEHAGYDSVWVLQRHFKEGNEHISAPLIFLTAAAQRTSRIHLGTAVITLPLEDLIRLAEDAATLDALASGRLELGLGSGPFASTWGPFGRDYGQRQEIYEANLARLTEILRGEPLSADGLRLHPSGLGVDARAWEATASAPQYAVRQAQAAAIRGHGLQFSRVNSFRAQTFADQAELIEVYRDAWTRHDREPRILTSRAVYPDHDRHAVHDKARDGVEQWKRYLSAFGRYTPEQVAAITTEEYLRLDGLAYATPDEIITTLLGDPSLETITDFLVSFVPLRPDLTEHRRLITETARQIAEPLGWHPRPNPTT